MYLFGLMQTNKYTHSIRIYQTIRHHNPDGRNLENYSRGNVKYHTKLLWEFYSHYRRSLARGGAVGWGTALQAGRSRVRFLMVEFFFDTILPAALWTWGWLRWVLGIFLGGKGSRCVGLTTLPPSCADCPEILEPQPPGTLRACPGL